MGGREAGPVEEGSQVVAARSPMRPAPSLPRRTAACIWAREQAARGPAGLVLTLSAAKWASTRIRTHTGAQSRMPGPRRRAAGAQGARGGGDARASCRVALRTAVFRRRRSCCCRCSCSCGPRPLHQARLRLRLRLLRRRVGRSTLASLTLTLKLRPEDAAGLLRAHFSTHATRTPAVPPQQMQRWQWVEQSQQQEAPPPDLLAHST